MHLIACPDCARQYDVTHLASGSRVRCQCDHVFSVEARGPLPVAALACEHCGGGVSPHDEACPYCGGQLSALDRHGTTLCPACYTRLADNARHCHACALEIRPQALTPLPESSACPRCQGGLRIRSLDAADVVECSDCGGLWLRPELFDEVCRRALHESPPARTGTPTARRSPERTIAYIPCLCCSEPMTRRQYTSSGRASGVVIDVCKNHGVWLDHDELSRIIAFARENGHRPMSRPTSYRTDTNRPASSTSLSTRRKTQDFGLRDVIDALREAFFGELL